jgi:hypothetical protein
MSVQPQVPAKPLPASSGDAGAQHLIDRIRERQADLNGTLFHFDSEIFGQAGDAIEGLVAEMKRFLTVIERAEAEPGTWERLTAGTGIATANAYRAILSRAS